MQCFRFIYNKQKHKVNINIFPPDQALDSKFGFNTQDQNFESNSRKQKPESNSWKLNQGSHTRI